MTLIEEQLEAIVKALGFAVESERPFPPYRVDVYCDELHVAFEADGPMHTRPRDKKRDAALLDQYALVVHRVPHHKLRNAVSRADLRREIKETVGFWSATAAARKRIASTKNPEGW